MLKMILQLIWLYSVFFALGTIQKKLNDGEYTICILFIIDSIFDFLRNSPTFSIIFYTTNSFPTRFFVQVISLGIN